MTEKTITVKEEIDAIIEKLSGKMKNYRQRPAQKTMISIAASTFYNARKQPEGTPQSPHIAVIQAPTGTGKSHGYLIPSIVMGKRLGKKVVVSSSTVKLQEQLYHSDLPLIASCIEGGVKYALVKGRSRYVCSKMLEKEASEAGQMSLTQGDSGSAAVKARDEKIIWLQKSHADNSWNGERDSVQVDDALWSDISTDRHSCLGRRCSHINTCPFFKAREGFKQADLLVVNHDLLLSDLSMGGGMLLPPPEESIYCVDEAHNLPDKTVQAFASQHMVGSAATMAERLSTAFSRAIPDNPACGNISRGAEALAETLADVEVMLQGIQTLNVKDGMLRFPFGAVPEELQTLGMNIVNVTTTILDNLVQLKEDINALITEGVFTAESSEKILTENGFYTGKVETVRDTWVLMNTMPQAKAPPIAKWIQLIPAGKDNDYLVCASPVSAASKLKNAFWDKAHAVVLTSATITALGSFSMFKMRSGLTFNPEDSICKALPSPFDHEKQGKIYLPKMTSDPKNAEAHTKEISTIIPKLFIDEAVGMLVLFSSRKQMEEVAKGLPANLRERVLIQGQVPMSSLIEMHREVVDSGKPSVLFGLAGLAEGLDLPGSYNVRVVIAKIPFAVPTNPIDAAIAEWLTSLGRNSFAEVSVPEASRKLEQAIGRLVRTETDSGDIYILDTRLASTSYGKNMLKGFPAYPVITGELVR